MLGRLVSKFCVKLDGDSKRVADTATPNDVDLLAAVKSGDFKAFELCMRKKCNVNATDEEGNTLLFISSVTGQADVVLKLLELRASLNKTSTGGNTPLHGAAEEGHLQVLTMLLEHGADPNTTNKHKHTPLHLAAKCGHAEAVTLLLNHGGDASVRDKDGRRPLDVALHCSQLDAAKRVASFTRDSAPLRRTSVRSLPRSKSTAGVGSYRTASNDEISRREDNDEFSLMSSREHLKPALSWDPPRTTYSLPSFTSFTEVSRSYRSFPGDVEDPDICDEQAQVTTSTASSSGSKKNKMMSAIWNATHRTPNRNTAPVAAAPARIYKRNGLWNSSDILEQSIMQQLSVGMTFGDNDRYEVKELINMNGACVAIVRHKWELNDCFAKFYINQTMFETEKQFYLFWPDLGAAMMRDIQMLWPVIKELYPVGSVANIKAGCIVLEKGDETLTHMVSRKGTSRAQTSDLHTIVSQLIESMSIMHEYGWVHRDIKPSNVVYFKTHGRWKLVDFGITAQAGMRMPIQYTLKYAPPEVVKAQYDGLDDVIVSCAMDIWSLGMVIASLFSQQKLFGDLKQSEWLSMLLGQKEFPFESNPAWFDEELPPDVAPLVRSMLCRDGAQRIDVKALESSCFFKPTLTRQSIPRNSMSHDSSLPCKS